MSKSKITLIGFYNYMNQKNDNLFKYLKLPDGINKNDFEDAVLMRAGELETLYSNPDFMAEAIGVWGRKWYNTFLKWITVLNIEYDPLDNYNRFEDWSETESEDEVLTTENEENGRLQSTDNTVSTSDGTTVNTVSAFNSSVYEPDNKTDTDTDVETTLTSNSTSKNNLDETVTKDNDIARHHTGRTHGNIGVTTTQHMLGEELDIAKWNLYDNMCDIFMSELLIPVY